MRNHELDASQSDRLGPYLAGQGPSPHAYDAASPGGVSRLVVDPQGKPLRSNLVLTGTNRNCAGGVSPWGWLTCEESVEPKHGYVFLCSPTLTAAAAATHPRVRSLLARGRGHRPRGPHRLPHRRSRRRLPLPLRTRAQRAPFGPGKLQALAIVGRPRLELGEELPRAAKLDVHWIDVPHAAGESEDALRYVAQKRGAAVVRRGEGIWRMADGFAITCTSGGPLSSGQVFHLAPTPAGGTLRLLAQSHEPSELDMPDNITLTPWGDLLVCEDNRRSNYLRIITRDGRVLPFAHNALSITSSRVRASRPTAASCSSSAGRRPHAGHRRPFDRLV